MRTQGFFSPILKGYAIRKIYICEQKAPIAEHLLTKTKHHLLNKSSIFAKNPQATPYEKGEIISGIEHSLTSFGCHFVVKSLANEVLCGGGMLTYPIVYGGHHY